MSLYNMINGVNPATFFVLPMLGEKHPDDYPRFRDCFMVRDPDGTTEIHVLTRVGGANRNSGYGEEILQSHPNFIGDEDQEDDSTYATYKFSIPEEFKEDFVKIATGNLSETSLMYQERVRKVFPKLDEKLDQLFKKEKDEQ